MDTPNSVLHTEQAKDHAANAAKLIVERRYSEAATECHLAHQQSLVAAVHRGYERNG